MRIITKKRAIGCAVAILVLAGAVGLLMALPASAQQPATIAPINPVPEVTPKGEILLEYNNKNYHGQGYIERMDKGVITIADMQFKMAPIVTYFSGASGVPAIASDFRPGVWVGYYLNEKREVASLWLEQPPR